MRETNTSTLINPACREQPHFQVLTLWGKGRDFCPQQARGASWKRALKGT